MGVAGGGPGEAPRGGAPTPRRGAAMKAKMKEFMQPSFFCVRRFYCRLRFWRRADNAELLPPIRRMRTSLTTSTTFPASGLEMEVREDTVAAAHAAIVEIADIGNDVPPFTPLGQKDVRCEQAFVR